MCIKSDLDYIDESGYYRHSCGCILLRVTARTQLQDAIIFCKKCHKEVVLNNIENGKIVKQIPNKNIA